jgi:hypothetical protein
MVVEAHNGAVVTTHVHERRGWHPDSYTMVAILLGVIFVVAVGAVVVTAMQGMTTAALIIALFTAAFFSRVCC